MKTVYKYIKFVHPIFDKLSWSCVNKRHGDLLGTVRWSSGWREHVFIAISDDIVFSASCLDDISHFMKQLNEKP